MGRFDRLTPEQLHRRRLVWTVAGAGTAAAAAAAFSGPGDVVSGAAAWWGLRAYSAATTGANLVRIRRVSDNVEQNFVSLSTGALDRASIVTFLAATTGRFVTYYDQIGVKHLTQATAANQAAVNLSGIGSLVTADFATAGPHFYTTAAALAQTQPFTLGAVAKSVNNGAQQSLYLNSSSTAQINYRNSANNQIGLFGLGSG